jgi:uncharacterized membrane protein
VAHSSKIVIAKSTRTNKKAARPVKTVRPRKVRDWRKIGRNFVIVLGVVAVPTLFLSAVTLVGPGVTFFVTALSILLAVTLWVRSKLAARGGTTPEKDLRTMQAAAMDIATNAYHPVSARNSAIRQARELTILLAAMDNATAGK